MAARIALSLAAALLVAAPVIAAASSLRAADPGLDRPNSGGAGQQPQGSDQFGNNDQLDGQEAMSDAQNFALVAGQILGAASACEQINEQRVSNASKKAVKVTSDTAEDEEDIQAAQQYMLDAAATGRNAVKNGDADCERVQQSFSRLEAVERNMPELQSQLDDPDAPARPAKPGDKDSSGDPDDAE